MFAGKRGWVNWKSLLTVFALLSSPLPSVQELAQYRVALTEHSENQEISCQAFVDVPCWFDMHEGKPSANMSAQWQAERDALHEQSDFDSDDEEQLENRLDRDRLTSIKTVLFNIHRVNTGADKLRIPTFIDLLTKLVSDAGDSHTFGNVLTK